MHRPALAIALLAVTACSDPETTAEGFVTPTEVAVDPLDFRGDVGCSVNDGAMKSYVMTLYHYDTVDDGTPFTIGSTVPTPCALYAGFRNVIVVGDSVNHRYTADVDAYDVPVELLVPFGGGSSGARQMRHAETGEIVPPRWTTQCGGSAATGARAIGNRRVFVRPCEPLTDVAPTPTQLAVPPSAVLGGEPCSVADSYSISFDSGGLPDTAAIPCDAADGFVFEADAGETYEIYATAMVGGALQGSECLAVGRAGETVTPLCSALSAHGSVSLSLDDDVCPAGHFYDVLDVNEGALNLVPIPCDQSVQLGPFVAGIRLFETAVYDAMGTAVGPGQSCAADVMPGKRVVATCL